MSPKNGPKTGEIGKSGMPWHVNSDDAALQLNEA